MMSTLVQPADDAIQTPILACHDLRVAIVSDAIAGRNGVGTYYQDLVTHLQDHVASIQLYGPRARPDRQLERFSVPLPGDATQRLAWPHGKTLTRRLDAQQPNLIVIPSMGMFSRFARRYAQRRRLPFVLVHHTDFERLLDLYWPGPWARPLGGLLQRMTWRSIRRASAVAVMSADGLRAARGAGAKMARVLGTPLAPEFIRTPQVARPAGLRRVVFVGRLAKEKGIADLLQAVQECPEIEFAIAGDGPLRPRVQHTAARHGNLRYLGWLSRTQVLNAVDQACGLVLPSTVETFGTVALEALARRRYVLLRPACGITHWPSISQGLFSIRDGESVGQALQRLDAMSDGDRQSQASISWDAVRSFNQHTIRHWLRFLHDVASGSVDAAPAALTPATRLPPRS